MDRKSAFDSSHPYCQWVTSNATSLSDDTTTDTACLYAPFAIPELVMLNIIITVSFVTMLLSLPIDWLIQKLKAPNEDVTMNPPESRVMRQSQAVMEAKANAPLGRTVQRCMSAFILIRQQGQQDKEGDAQGGRTSFLP